MPSLWTSLLICCKKQRKQVASNAGKLQAGAGNNVRGRRAARTRRARWIGKGAFVPLRASPTVCRAASWGLWKPVGGGVSNVSNGPIPEIPRCEKKPELHVTAPMVGGVKTESWLLGEAGPISAPSRFSGSACAVVNASMR